MTDGEIITWAYLKTCDCLGCGRAIHGGRPALLFKVPPGSEEPGIAGLAHSRCLDLKALRRYVCTVLNPPRHVSLEQCRWEGELLWEIYTLPRSLARSTLCRVSRPLKRFDDFQVDSLDLALARLPGAFLEALRIDPAPEDGGSFREELTARLEGVAERVGTARYGVLVDLDVS